MYKPYIVRVIPCVFFKYMLLYAYMMLRKKGSGLMALLITIVLMMLVIAGVMQAGNESGSPLERNEDGEVKAIDQANEAADILNIRNDTIEEVINY